jgi:ATP-dependent exoDNAse (exonuclease V) beta subunit
MKESPHKEAKKIDLSDFTDAQKEAVKHRGANLLVSAGAGTGKTRVLVARFVHLVVEDKIDVDSILSVTFTEKAADEMKERIARSFEKLSMTAQKHAVGNAHIGTIHGFCTKILRENPFAAGIDPEFEVMSEIDQVILMEEVFNELLEEGNEDLIGLVDNLDEIKLKTGLRAYVDLNRCLGRKPDRINVLIKKPEVLVESLRMEANSCLLGIQKEAAEKAQMLKNLSCSGQIEEHRKAIIALLKGVGDNTNDTSALSSVLDYFSRIRLSGGRADDSDREEIVEILKAIRDFVRGKDNCNVLLLRSGPEALQQDI